MQIILNNYNHPKIIEISVKTLNAGGIIVYPSDTVYGLATDATNPVSLINLDKLKSRREDQKYSFNFSDLEMLKKFHEITTEQEEILSKYLPGPYTFILAPDLSVRIPKNSIICEITKIFGKPTTATSANLTGNLPTKNIKLLEPKIYLAADLIIDDPEFDASPPSTIVDISGNTPKVIRQGELSFP